MDGDSSPPKFVRTEALSFFSAEEVARARAYHRPLYWVAGADVALQAGVLAALAWSGAGAALDPGSLPWWARTPAYAAIVVAASAVVRSPLALWSGFIREWRWGFSTQRLPSWAADRAKAAAVNSLLTAAALLGLAALLLSFVAPVVLEPLFNRYSPLRDEALAAQLHTLARRASVPVRDMLVQDTSRRTRKANAYVSGLGRTRRIVVSDTLLEQAPPAEVRLVVAHELAHRRHRHVLLATLLAMAGAVTATVVVWGLLGTRVGDPHRIPLVLLIGLGIGLTSLPALTAVSRRWERAADRYALQLTGDRAAYENAFRRLAHTNLADLDPPRLFYLLLFTHPTPPERLAAGAAALERAP